MIIKKPSLVDKQYYPLFVFLTAIFFMWGLALTLSDVLNRHFQSVLQISKSKSAFIQFSIFGAYTLIAIPAGIYMKKYGYKKGILLGLSLYAIGAFLFIPAANLLSFDFFRFAIFLLACGMAILETVAHPFIAALGDQDSSDQRINFAQSFNGLGGVVGPAIGSFFLLDTEANVGTELSSVKQLYVCIGIVVIAIATAFFFLRVPKKINYTDSSIKLDSADLQSTKNIEPLFRKKHFTFAVLAQFFNVAAQGGTWAFFINYGHEVMNFSDKKAGYFFSISILLLVLGRFIGTYLMRFIQPYVLLTFFALGNIVMCIIVAQGWGWISFTALLFINFFFSIMFPTIFSLGIKDLGSMTPKASSYIIMGMLGGAIFPPLMGLIANHTITKSYYLPIICYLVIFIFGYKYPSLNKSLMKNKI